MKGLLQRDCAGPPPDGCPTGLASLVLQSSAPFTVVLAGVFLRERISARDEADSSRRASPLIIAEDAHVIDSSNLTIDGVVGEIIGRLKLKGLTIAS